MRTGAKSSNTMVSSLRVGLMLLLAGAVVREAHGQPPGPRPGVPRLEVQRPVGAIHLPCLVRAEIEPRVVGRTLRLRLVLVGVGGETRTVTLRGTCPKGVIGVQGLPRGFDPMHTC